MPRYRKSVVKEMEPIAYATYIFYIPFLSRRLDRGYYKSGIWNMSNGNGYGMYFVTLHFIN